ncbi:hypothetical protein FHG87_019910 [Trinorchestia longiramus]|nr:hypothetical protein FHG87_019910 [Trinorchestia longiramus]
MASPLEHLVSEVTSHISQKKYSEAAKHLQKSRDTLSKNSGHLDTVLATLQPQVHTIAVAAVLRARLAAATPNDANIDTLHATVAEFVSVCDQDQLGFVQDAMCEMLEEYCRLLVTGGCSMRGIEVINSAVSTLACLGESVVTMATLHHRPVLVLWALQHIHVCMLLKRKMNMPKIVDVKIEWLM